MSEFISQRRNVVCEGLTVDDLEKPPTVDTFGEFVPVEIKSKVFLSEKAVLAQSLNFQISACTPSNTPNLISASCNGGGTINPSGNRAFGGASPLLRENDEGICSGICLIQTGPVTVPIPKVCRIRIKARGASDDRMEFAGSPSTKVAPVHPAQVEHSNGNAASQTSVFELYYQFHQGAAPVAGLAFKVLFGDGTTRCGRLDDNGYCRISDAPEGEAEIELGDEGDEALLIQSRSQLASALDQLVNQAAERAKQIQADLDQRNLVGAGLQYGKAFLSGLWSSAAGTVEFVWDVGVAVVKFHWQTNLRIIQAVYTGDLTGIREGIDELAEMGAEVAETLEQAKAALEILITDPETWAILKAYPERYVRALHAMEVTETVGGMSFDILLALVTGGAGALGSALSKSRYFHKASGLIQKLIKLLKRRKLRKKVSGRVNRPVHINVADDLPWDFWGSYKHVTINGQKYAKIGNRYYTEHAVNRMTPRAFGEASSTWKPKPNVSDAMEKLRIDLGKPKWSKMSIEEQMALTRDDWMRLADDALREMSPQQTEAALQNRYQDLVAKWKGTLYKDEMKMGSERGKEKGWSIAPRFVEDVLSSDSTKRTKVVKKDGEFFGKVQIEHESGSLKVVTNEDASIVITIHFLETGAR